MGLELVLGVGTGSSRAPHAVWADNARHQRSHLDAMFAFPDRASSRFNADKKTTWENTPPCSHAPQHTLAKSCATSSFSIGVA